TPEESRKGYEKRITQVLPGARGLLLHEIPFVYDPPISVLAIKGESSHPHQQLDRLRAKLEAFVLSLRLLHACTTQTYFEVSGPTKLISSVGTHTSTFRASRPLVRRTKSVFSDDEL